MADDTDPELQSNGPRGDSSGASYDEEKLTEKMQPGARDRFKRMAAREGTRAALHAAEAGLFGEKIKPLAKLANEEFKNLSPEKLNKMENAIFDNPGQFKDPGWYKEQAKQGSKNLAKKGFRAFVRRQKALLIVTLLVNIVVVIGLLILFFIAPFKHIHFETILRSANFARFQLIIRKQFSAVIFNASVLTRDSVGNYRNSPLARQIRLAVPDRQLAELGRQGVIQFDFHPNSSFGNDLLPLRETLRAVVIRGQRIDLDDLARQHLGRPYNQLDTRGRYYVQNQFIRTVNVQLGDLMALMPRHVRWNPMVRLHQRTGIRLVKWLNAARDYRGLTEAEARARLAEETSRRVMAPDRATARSAIPDINSDAEQARTDYVDGARQGRPRITLRSRVAAQARVARGVSDVVFATTAYCIARELYNAFSSPEAAADREAQAARMAANDMTTTDQGKSHDITAPAWGAASGQWDGNEDVGDASQAVLYKRITNEPIPNKEVYQKQQVPFLDPHQVFGEWQDEFDALGKGIDSPLAAVLSLLGIDFNIGQKEVNDKVCQAMLNEYVQYGIAVGEIALAIYTLSASKGITAAIKGALELVFHFAVGLGLGELLNLLIEWVVKEYARLYFTGLEKGADRFNTGYVAQNSIAQSSSRNVTYGRPMDLGETNAAQELAMQELRKEHNSKGLAHRYLAIDNPFSLLGLTVAKIPVSTGGFAATLQNGVHFMGSILSSPTRLIGSVANALMPAKFASAEAVVSKRTNFGVTQWGWTVDEQSRIENDESFSMDAPKGQDPPLLAYVEPRLDEFNERYAKCYDPETFVLQSDEPKNGVHRICTKELLSTNDALHWRYYMALMFAAKELTGSVLASE